MQRTRSKRMAKVAILGAAGGIGQPLSMLMMLHSDYIQHLALYDLTANIHGVGLDVSHIDRPCRVTTHMGQEELADAVRDAKVIIIPAGLAQKPGMSRDDLFGSNAKIMFNLAQVCAKVAPKAMLAIISNPVNSLVPLTCEVYHKFISSGALSSTTSETRSAGASPQSDCGSSSTKEALHAKCTAQKVEKTKSAGKSSFHDCFRRIFGVTTLDVTRASSLTARSALFKPEPNGLFKDPSKLSVPVLGGHAGKTIMPMLSMASPKLDRKRLAEDKATTSTIVDSIQRAGIDVLNAKKGTGSATLAMAYAACRFTISLLKAQQGEQNIVECAYVRHKQPLVNDLEYFAMPLLLGKDGYVRATPFDHSKLLPYEQQMIEEGCKDLRTSIAKGEDFARENLYKER